MNLYLRKKTETMVSIAERYILDDPVLKSLPVSQGDVGLSHLFNEETSHGIPDMYDSIAELGLFCVE